MIEKDVFTEFEFLNKPWVKLINAMIFIFGIGIVGSLFVLFFSAKAGLWLSLIFSSVIFLLYKVQDLYREYFYFHYQNEISKKQAAVISKLNEEQKITSPHLETPKKQEEEIKFKVSQ